MTRLSSRGLRCSASAAAALLVALAASTSISAGTDPAAAQPQAAMAHGPATAAAAGSTVPRPQHWQPGQGSTRLGTKTRIVVDPRSAGRWTAGPRQPGLSDEHTMRTAKTLADDLGDITGLRIKSRAGKTLGAKDVGIKLVDDSTLGPEGYRLHIGSGIRIEAATSTGVYYAGRTLAQSLRRSADRRTVANGSVVDRPDQRWRQVMLDAGRKYWKPAYLRNLIRRMSWQKLNVLYIQFSDAEGFRLNSPEFPGLADAGVSYDEAEIRDLVTFANAHHVMLVPGIDVPGHATVLSDYFDVGFGDGPEPCGSQHMHSHLTPDWVLDLTDKRSAKATGRLLREFMPWFTAPYAHLGADELPGQLGDCPRVQRALASDPNADTLGDLLSRFINGSADTLEELGKRAIIYNGVEHMESPKQNVDDDVVYMTWEGNGSEPEIPNKDEIATGPFYLTPNNYHNNYPDESWMYDEWRPSSAADMLGSGVMNWADYNFWADDQYFERLMAMPRAILADRTWNASPTPDKVAEFRARVASIGDAPDVVGPTDPPRDDDAKPIHHWTFDDANYPAGWTYAGSPGNTILAEDAAGNLPGSSYIIWNPESVPGVAGQAWHFDDDRDGVGFGGVDLAAPWTFSGWVRRTGSTGNQTLLSSKSAALKLEQTGTCGNVGYTAKGVADYSFDYVAPADEWVHLTMVARPAGIDLYVNGAHVGNAPGSVGLPLRSIGDVGSSLRGDLDEVQVYDEALDAAEVQAAYDAFGVTGSEKHGDCRANTVGDAADE